MVRLQVDIQAIVTNKRRADYRCWHGGLVEPCENREFRPSEYNRKEVNRKIVMLYPGFGARRSNGATRRFCERLSYFCGSKGQAVCLNTRSYHRKMKGKRSDDTIKKLSLDIVGAGLGNASQHLG